MRRPLIEDLTQAQAQAVTHQGGPMLVLAGAGAGKTRVLCNRLAWLVIEGADPGAILALTSLDFLGLGVPPSTASLGELLAQGKANLDAWWITLSTFGVLVGTLMLLIFIGEALRGALDTRRG